MVDIQEEDFIQSIADAFQYISYYHPVDFITAMGECYKRELNPAAKDAIAQILTNSRLCALGKRPICQDTGICVVFLKIGMQVRFSTKHSLHDLVNKGVARAYSHTDNKLRASVVSHPYTTRVNTGDNTPAVLHVEMVPGFTVEVIVAAKGGGSENKSRFTILNPADTIIDWVTRVVPTLGAGWCPPGILGIGIGGTPEKAMLMAKESLMQPINMHSLQQHGPKNKQEELRLAIFNAVNALGIGAQGLGGVTTVLDVKILDFPTHAASLPVALIPNCAATRHTHFILDGSGPCILIPPDLNNWPDVQWTANESISRKVNLDTLTAEETQSWKVGETLLLSGYLYTARDAAHKRLQDMFEAGEASPVNLHNKVIYYVGPVDPVRDEIIGPAGPTTATRMDKFMETTLSHTGILATIGKAERGPVGIAAIKKHRTPYLIAVGGAAYLVAQAVRKARVVAFKDLGMEGIYELKVDNMPVTVAVDATGESVHVQGPQLWRQRIHMMPKITS